MYIQVQYIQNAHATGTGLGTRTVTYIYIIANSGIYNEYIYIPVWGAMQLLHRGLLSHAGR